MTRFDDGQARRRPVAMILMIVNGSSTSADHIALPFEALARLARFSQAGDVSRMYLACGGGPINREKPTCAGATASDQRESAVRTSLDLAHQLTVRTADFLRALAVAPGEESLPASILVGCTRRMHPRLPSTAG